MVIGPFLTLGPHPIQYGTLHYNNHLDQPFGTLFGHFGTLTSLPCLRLAIFDKKKTSFGPPRLLLDMTLLVKYGVIVSLMYPLEYQVCWYIISTG